MQPGNEGVASLRALPASAVMQLDPCPHADTASGIDRKFEQAVKLAHVLAEARLDSGRTLREALFLDQRISLWDVVVANMVLYRFPLPFVSGDGQPSWWSQVGYWMRPYRGLAAKFIDHVSRPPVTASDCGRWPSTRRPVLVTCFTRAFYRQLLQPVAEAIVKQGLGDVVVLHGGPPAESWPKERALSIQSIWNHWDDEVDRRHRNLAHHLQRLKNEVLGESQLSSLMKEISRQFGTIKVKNEFVWLFWREFIRLAPQWAVAEHILLRHRPALVISADDADPRCRLYSLSAKAVGVPTLLVQQGLSSQAYPEWRFLSHDKVAAMGERSRRDLTAQGVDPERIVVTGHPGFDTFAGTDPEAAATVRSDLDMPPGNHLVLFASQPGYVGAFDHPKKRMDMIKAVVKVVESMNDVTLVIKPHPGERGRELAALMGRARRVVLVDGAVDIGPLIKACDVFITFFSTTALQALYAGKPVVTIDVPGSGGGGVYIDSEATWVARSGEDIRLHLTTLLSPRREEFQKTRAEARQRFLREMVCVPDGNATDRVMEVVSELLEPKAMTLVSS